MNSSSFPDVNVWLALLMADHVHRMPATHWWDSNQAEVIAFSRFTQIGVLRLLTTSAAMNGRPLTMAGAWSAYDRLFDDDRVYLIPEPPNTEQFFRVHTSRDRVSPKIWADAYLLAFASAADLPVDHV